MSLLRLPFEVYEKYDDEMAIIVVCK